MRRRSTRRRSREGTEFDTVDIRVLATDLDHTEPEPAAGFPDLDLSDRTDGNNDRNLDTP
jgi:hypothetical protein